MTIVRIHAPARRRSGGALLRLLGSALAAIVRWNETARERRSLLELDERTLRDIGLTRADVEREALRPFWDTASDRPRHWR